MDVLSSRILLRPSDPDRSHRFYRDILGLAIYREFGPPDDPGLVFFLGQGLLEVSGHAAGPPGHSVMIFSPHWLPNAEPETRTGNLTCKNSVELRGFEPLIPSSERDS